MKLACNSPHLERELLAMAGENDLLRSVVKLGIATQIGDCPVLSVIEDWYRSGAETYSLVFDWCQDGGTRRFIIKACVASNFGMPLEQTLGRWLERRRLVREHGIPTPRLYGVGKGVILEEFVPFTWSEAALLQQGAAFYLDTARLLGNLSWLGFRPTAIVNDLRSRGRDTVIVDFGEDLGEPSHSTDMRSSERIVEELVEFMQKRGFDDGVIAAANQIFRQEASLSRRPNYN